MPVLFIDLSSSHKVEKVCENVVLVGFGISGPFEALKTKIRVWYNCYGYHHLEFLDKEVAAQDTQSIADKDIQNEL